MNWESGANCFLLKAVHTYGKNWELVSTALKMIARIFLRDEQLYDLSEQSCSLQYNYLIASTRQKYADESDETKLLKLAVDYYTGHRREKLHATRLELLKKIKIAEDDSEKLRERRFSEIPMNRLTVYRKRCRAFGIADFIGQHLGLEPLPPATENEDQTIRDSVIPSDLFDSSCTNEVNSDHRCFRFPLCTTFQKLSYENDLQSMQTSMTEFLRAQAVLSRRIGTEIHEDETSSVDTSSSIQTHPDVHECEDTPYIVAVSTTRRAYRRFAASDAAVKFEDTEDETTRSQPTASQDLRSAPFSPSSPALISDTDTLTSPLVIRSMNSSPCLFGTELNSPDTRKVSRSASRKRRTNPIPVATQHAQSITSEPALSPLASEGGHSEEFGSTGTSDLLLARRWRRSLLIALSTLCSHRHAYVFMNPVTEDIAPGYSSVVYEPVDLTSLRRHLEATLSSLSSSQQVSVNPTQLLIDAALGLIRDLMLMFVNARMYNSQNHEVYKMAGDMFSDCMIELQPLWSVLVEDIPGFPLLPQCTKPSAAKTSGRSSLRPITPKSLTIPVPSPLSHPSAQRLPDGVSNVRTTVTVTRPSKRTYPDTPFSTSPLPKRHQSSTSEASTSQTARTK